MNTEDDFRTNPADELAERIAYLINGYIRENLTSSEHDELDEWATASFKNQQLFEELTDPVNIKKWMDWKGKLDSHAALDGLRNKLGIIPERPVSKMSKYLPYWIAAAVFIGVLVAADLIFQKPGPAETPKVALQQDLQPGGKHAVLTLGDGRAILLDTIHAGAITTDHDLHITRDSGQLTYGTARPTVAESRFNTLSTPAGGEFQVSLSDGTRVWLNASSSLKYPEFFTDSVRTVQLTGEAYFEVAKDATHPFIVRTGDNDIRVLGTHFGISHYPDAKKTVVTLAEGSVRLNGTVILKPGEEGSIDPAGKIDTGPADFETAFAWKQGQFVFKMTAMEEVMDQVAHWYDARIVYQDQITEHFNARIPRNVPVSQLLHLLEATGRVHFKIDNKTIIVMN